MPWVPNFVKVIGLATVAYKNTSRLESLRFHT